MSGKARPGLLAPPELLVDVAQLRREYYARVVDGGADEERVHFGTTGHRGSALSGSFNESHVVAITQAICDYRKGEAITGPLFLGRDTHALSTPAFATALEVLAANDVDVMLDCNGGFTPTPVVSHAIVRRNRGRTSGASDGIVLTSSRNPPTDGGLKYNPPHGGPAGLDVTRWIEDRANVYLARGIGSVRRVPYERALHCSTTHTYDFTSAYVDDLVTVVDLEAIRGARLRIGVDPMGGAAIGLWGPIAEQYGLDVEVVNHFVDPTFRFVPLDGDGQIRMDCSSHHAMARLVEVGGRYDIAVATDPDADRHGIVTRGGGMISPTHALVACIAYLFTRRPGWPRGAAIGKTVVASALIDRLADRLGRRLVEMPVGFRWFVPGLLEGTIAFAGDERAAASFVRRSGEVWVTETDGIVMGLLAAELMARTGRDPAESYADVIGDLALSSDYKRIDTPATGAQLDVLRGLTPSDVPVTSLAGDPVIDVVTAAPGNGAPIGGVKVMTAHGWFAARASSTAPIRKLYAESLRGPEHLRLIQRDAIAILDALLQTAGADAIAAADE